MSFVLGYVLLDGGAVDPAPALLVLGYVVLIPLRMGTPPRRRPDSLILRKPPQIGYVR